MLRKNEVVRKYNDNEKKDHISQCTDNDPSKTLIDQCNSEIPCNTENKSIINQLKAQGNEASQIIINLQHERDANLNKLNVMLSNIEEMESEMRFTK